MSVQGDRTLEVLETELADVDLGEGGEVRGVGGGVPHIHLVRPKLHQPQLVFVGLLPSSSLQCGGRE